MDVLQGGNPIADGGTDNVPDVPAGSQVLRQYTVSNADGWIPLEVEKPSVTNLNNVWSINAKSFPMEIPVGSTDAFTVQFTVGTGTYSFDLNLGNNDLNEDPFEYNNLASDADHDALVEVLSRRLKTGWRAALP